MQKLLVLLVLASAAIATGGCATVKGVDGREALAFRWPLAGDDAGARAATETAGSLGSAVGGTLFGPIGAVIGEYFGTGAAATVLAAVGWFSGRNRGWDENDEYHGRDGHRAAGRRDSPGRPRGEGGGGIADPPTAAQPAAA